MNSAADYSAVTSRASVDSSSAEDEGGSVTYARFRPRVLFVDDEPEVLAGLRRALIDDPYQISTALSADRALGELWQNSYDVVVADERMPGMTGSELLAIIAREFPLMGRILLTGHATVHSAAQAVNQGGIVRLLLKPCPPAALREAIETALRATPHDRRIRNGHRRARSTPAPQPRANTRHPTALPSRDAAAPTPVTRIGSRQAHPEPTFRPDREVVGTGLVLRAQKVVELRTERLFGYELASRLEPGDSKVGTLGGVTETSGQHVVLPALDRWSLRHVIQWAVEHRDILDAESLTISLNLSAHSLADPAFARFLDQELLDTRIASRFLIEVRESALAKSLRTDEGLLGRLLKLRCYGAGARLCIDGVGGALWRLGVLRNLPVAMAKIDSRFVCNVLTHNQSEFLVRTAVEWGQRTGVSIAATGIDTRTVAGHLQGLGVRYGQGSHFGGTEPTSFRLGKPLR
jgi:EAL domain-containing protein (putative c-di-GMP-specific phosphodiesterase class I)/CheY-like chemotaxis protein